MVRKPVIHEVERVLGRPDKLGCLFTGKVLAISETDQRYT